MSILFSFMAVFIGLLFSRIDELLINENGNTAKIKSLGLGYYFWIASFAFLFSGVVWGIFISK